MPLGPPCLPSLGLWFRVEDHMKTSEELASKVLRLRALIQHLQGDLSETQDLLRENLGPAGGTVQCSKGHVVVEPVGISQFVVRDGLGVAAMRKVLGPAFDLLFITQVHVTPHPDFRDLIEEMDEDIQAEAVRLVDLKDMPARIRGRV